MAWTKAKTAVVVGTGLLLAAGTAIITVKEIQERRTYPWQVPQANHDVLHQTPPQVRIAPSRFAKSGGWVGENDKVLGIAQPAAVLVMAAYRSRPTRAILPAELPPGLFDYIANFPQGSAQALQQEVRRKIGLSGKREVRETDVLLLKVKNPATQGFKRADKASGERNPLHRPALRAGGGWQTWHDSPVSMLAAFLEDQLKTPVLDQTKLMGDYDFDIKWDSAEPEALKRALLDQLGLELVPSREPVEMLVVEKAK